MHVFPLCATATTSGYSILMILAVLVMTHRGSIYTYDSWGLRRPDLSFKLLTRALFTGIFLLVIAFIKDC